MNNGIDDGFETRQKLNNYFQQEQFFLDFLEWLFDTEIYYMTQQEAIDKFELFRNTTTDQK